jgi:hypothetical protein
MPVQPQLFPDSPPAAHESTQPGAPPHAPLPEPAAIAPVWLQRLSLFILVIFCIYLGVIVAVLPWWTSVWDHNLLLISHPALWAVLRTPAARGVISGFGLLDIWIGISEAIHYHDQRN